MGRRKKNWMEDPDNEKVEKIRVKPTYSGIVSRDKSLEVRSESAEVVRFILQNLKINIRELITLTGLHYNTIRRWVEMGEEDKLLSYIHKFPDEARETYAKFLLTGLDAQAVAAQRSDVLFNLIQAASKLGVSTVDQSDMQFLTDGLNVQVAQINQIARSKHDKLFGKFVEKGPKH
ncbi:hypothetical protein IT568_10595 [bacterium]|nr:hypothetical protein [bacterium]